MNDRELNIFIGNSIVTCPEKGTIINNPPGFVGQIKCPNYNNICTSKIWCNELFECIDKKSEPKEESYYYDYEIYTSQDIFDNDAFEIEIYEI